MKRGYDATTLPFAKDRRTVKGLNLDALAVEALGFLAADPERLGTFLSATGLDVASLRTAALEPGFATGILGFVADDEKLLVSFAASQDLSPEKLGAAIAAQRHPPGLE